MHRIFTIILFALTLSITAFGQQPKASPSPVPAKAEKPEAAKPDPIKLADNDKQVLDALNKQIEEGGKQLEQSRPAALEAQITVAAFQGLSERQQRMVAQREALLFRLLSELGLKASEVEFKDGQLFKREKRDEKNK